MKEQGLFGRQKGRWRVRTTDSNHFANRSRPIAWPKPARRAAPIRSGSATSLLSRPPKAGSMWPPSSTSILAKSLAGT
jgi:hypothetical protein